MFHVISKILLLSDNLICVVVGVDIVLVAPIELIMTCFYFRSLAVLFRPRGYTTTHRVAAFEKIQNNHASLRQVRSLYPSRS